MKRIISTILTISMLFTMIPAFASDIETSDVNSNAQFFNDDISEAPAELYMFEEADFEEQEVYTAILSGAEGNVVASSAKKQKKTVADMESCAIVSNATSASNMPFTFSPVAGGNYDIVEENGNKYVTFRQQAAEPSSTTGIAFPASNVGKNVVASYKLRFDAINGGWTMFNMGNVSSLYLSGKSFKINEAGGGEGGQYDLKTGAIEIGVWYTIKYVIDMEAYTYNITITKEDGTEIANADRKARYWDTANVKLDSLKLYTSQKDADLCQMSVDDVTFHTIEEGLFFDVVGGTTLGDDEELKIAYSNTTSEDKDVCVTYVALEDGVVVDTDEDIVTLSTDNITATADVSVDTTDCVGVVTYEVYVTDVATGGTLCTAGSKTGTTVPENFVTVAEANGQINVSVAKDSAYDAALIRIYDEDENLVGIKEKKITSDAPISFDVKNYNQEYTADVTLTDAVGNCAYAEDSVIVWNPNIAADFNAAPETAFATHMDALNRAYEGFEEIYNANPDYINSYISERNDYTSVYDVAERVISLGGFLEVIGAEDEVAFARALEANADSIGIVIDNFYYVNKDAIIAKLYAGKEDELYVLPEELVEAYNDIYVTTEFNVAPAISYGRLFKKYADVLEIVVDKTYTNGEATINELIFAAKEENGGFEDMKAIAVAFKLAKNNAENPIGYETIAKSPVSKEEVLVNFEEDTAAYTVGIKTGMEAYGSYEVVEEDDNKYLRMVQTAGGEDAVQFTAKELPYSGIVNVSEKIKFESLDKGYTLLRIMGVYLYIENYKWGMNYGGGTMDTAGTIESVKTGVWYNINIELNFDGKTNNDKTFEATIYDENGNLVFEDSGSFRPSASEDDYKSIVVVTPHRDDRDGKVNLTEDDTIVCVDDIRVAVKPAPAVYYSAKALNGVVAGSNGMAVAVENLTGEDRAMGVYVPVYVDGVLYTVAYARDYFANGVEKELIIDYVLPADVDTSKVTYSVIVADGFDGLNHSVTSATTAGILEVDATADFEKDTIKVTAQSTFDNGTIIVLAPGATLANAIPSDILYYAAGKTATVKVADGINGELKVFAVAQDAEGNVTVDDCTVYYPGNGVAKNLVADFSAVTDANVANVVSGYLTLINAIEPGMITFYNDNSVEVNAALVANKPYETADDVITVFKSVKALKALKAAASEAEFKTAFDNFVSMFDVKFDDIYTANEDKFISDLFAAKDGFNTYADVLNVYNEIYMIFDINTATEDTIGDKLTKYADILGIALDDVYTTKQAYMDRLIVADMPFADKAAIVSSYNIAYAKAEEIEGDFSYINVGESASKIKKYEYDFEELDVVSGQTGTFDSADKSYTISTSSASTYDIVDDNGNKYIRLNQPAGDEDKAKLKINNLAVGAKTSLSYRIMFESLDKGYTRLQYGGGSVFYIQSERFGVNYGGGKMDQTGSKENVTTNVWYNVNYSVEYDANDKNKCKYDVVVTKDDGKLVFESRNCVFRDSGIASIEFVTPHRDDPKDGPAALTEDDTVMCIDAIKSSAFEADKFYYTATGTMNLLPGNNKLSFDMNNTTAGTLTANIYVPVYVDGKLVSVTTKSVSVEPGIKSSADVTVSAPVTGKVGYDVFVVESLNGVNYGVSSTVEGQAITAPATPVADYSARVIKVSGETTYDNMTVVVTAPTANSSVYDITAANANPDVIAYYGNMELKKGTDVNSFNADIKIPDKFTDGEYNVYFVSQNAAGQVVTSHKTVYYAGSTKLDDMLADFNAVTDANVETTINTYMDVLLGVASDMDAFYAANKAAVNAAVLAAKPYANVGVINNTIFAIYAVDKLKNAPDADTFKDTIEYYSNVFGLDVVSDEYKAGKAEISNRLFNDRANITKDNLKAKFEDALMLSEFNNATREEASAVLNKYASKLGITVNAAYMNSIVKAIAADGVVFNSAQDVKDAYNKGIELGQNDDSNNPPIPSAPTGSSGGGGGGAGGSVNDKVYFDQPYVEPEKTVDGGAVTKVAFNDLDTVSWAVEAITELKKIGVINGVSETEFAPNREVTREEFAKMIVNAFSVTGSGKTFADVPATAWYAPYVTALASSGIVNGVSETKFGVGTKITRQDAAVILDRTALNTGIEFEHRYSASVNFKDYIADYAFDSVLRLYQNGVINGTSEGIFSATATLTRAQAAKMIYSLMQLK